MKQYLFSWRGFKREYVGIVGLELIPRVWELPIVPTGIPEVTYLRGIGSSNIDIIISPSKGQSKTILIFEKNFT
jgi:hypothetical protein